MRNERERPAPTAPEVDEELGGEPPCWAHLLDDDGHLPAAEPPDPEPAAR